jgi:hypothetical protein
MTILDWFLGILGCLMGIVGILILVWAIVYTYQVLFGSERSD